jgi:hypothetical protein
LDQGESERQRNSDTPPAARATVWKIPVTPLWGMTAET